jgi:ATP-dependent RNA helicase MSS116
VTLALRAYSAATKLKEEEDFFSLAEDTPAKAPAAKADSLIPDEAVSDADDGFFTDELTAEETKAQKAQKSPDAPDDAKAASALVPFHSLKGRMDSDLLKALTFKPFNLIAMSEVQKRVLSRMPELAGGLTQKCVRESETPEQVAAREERESRGREDLLVKAKTGTGKTIAFLVPGMEARVHQIDKIVTAPLKDGSYPTLADQGQHRRTATRSHVGTLVISPTRELATQIANEALKLLTWQKENQVQLLVGGESRNMQLKNWKSIRYGRKDVVVATPGRLVDLLSEPEVADAIAKTDVLVLDEADTLLDMGFSEDLKRILEHLPKKRQTFLFSATVSQRIKGIAREFLDKNHSFIDCVPANESNVHKHIPQYLTILPSPKEQLSHLTRLIAHDQITNKGASKIIVFLPTTKQTMLTATLLREMSSSLPHRLNVHEIHSRLSQNQRTRASERFRSDKSDSILVTSDVSARGVDYPGVTRVIQIGVPSSAEQYVHRVGRTGRGGVTGGRGDIVLQQFEAGFQDAVRTFPITNVSTDRFQAELEGLAKGTPSEERLAGIDAKVEQLLPLLDPTAIEDVFMSLLGYYLGKGDVMSQAPEEIYEGLKEWSMGAGGLPQPPHISPSMLTRLGLTPKQLSRGRGRPPQDRRSFGVTRTSGRDDRPSRRFGDRNDRGDRPPRRDFGDRNDRPRRDFGDRPQRSFDRNDRPRRDFDRGSRDGDRPRRDFNRGNDRNDWNDRPRRSFSRNDDMF